MNSYVVFFDGVLYGQLVAASLPDAESAVRASLGPSAMESGYSVEFAWAGAD